MNEEFMGYERPKGKVGIRNKIAIIPSVICVNHVAEQIASKLDDTVAITHPSKHIWRCCCRFRM